MVRFPRIRIRAATAPLAALFALAALVGFGAPPTLAQDANLRDLIDRMDRLQRELATLQRHVYRGESVPAGAMLDEITDTQAARIEVRLSQFEQQVRVLTGQLEEQTFRMRQMTQRLDKLVADVDLRLQRLEGGGPVQSGDASTGDSGTASTTFGSAPAAATGTPKVLGQVAASDMAALQSPAGGGDYALPGGSAQDHYDHAFRLLSQNDFQEAERALIAFLKEHPKDNLAGNAKYWLGETYYVRQNYAEAAITFAEGYQSYPESVKAPDNLLKLGKSLAALGKKDDACGTYAELLRRYANASPTILGQAKTDRRRLNCQ